VDLFEKITKENKTWLVLENIWRGGRLLSSKTEEFRKFRFAIYLVHSIPFVERHLGWEFRKKFNVKRGFITNDIGALLGDIPIFVCNYLSYQLRGGKSLYGSSDNRKVCRPHRGVNFLTTFATVRRWPALIQINLIHTISMHLFENHLNINFLNKHKSLKKSLAFPFFKNDN